MRTAIFAALLAFGAASVVPVQAASITITTDSYDNGPRYRHDNGRHLGWERGRHRGWYKNRRHARRDCDVRVERYWRNGRLIIERTRDCD
jgi:hypothetical protein